MELRSTRASPVDRKRDEARWVSNRVRNICFNQPPPNVPPQIHKGLIAGLIKGNQWLISPDHKAGYFLGGLVDQP